METEYRTILMQRKMQSRNKQKKNVLKHMRIANATRGLERQVHMNKVEKLRAKYGI